MSYIGRPQQNVKNVSVSNTNAALGLAIIRVGYTSTATLMLGEGASCVHTSTGLYTMTWTTPFADAPSVTSNAATTAGSVNLTIAIIRSITNLGCLINLLNTAGVVTDADFNLIAIGQRST